MNDLKELKLFKGWEVNYKVDKSEVRNHIKKSSIYRQNLDIMRKVLRAELSSYVLDDIIDWVSDPKDAILHYRFKEFKHFSEIKMTDMENYIDELELSNKKSLTISLGWMIVIDEFKKEIEYVLNSIKPDCCLILITTEFEQRSVADLKFILPIIKIGLIKKEEL